MAGAVVAAALLILGVGVRSVGALMAVSGSVALTIIDGSPTPEAPETLALAIGAGVVVTLILGVWNGFLVSVLGI